MPMTYRRNMITVYKQIPYFKKTIGSCSERLRNISIFELISCLVRWTAVTAQLPFFCVLTGTHLITPLRPKSAISNRATTGRRRQQAVRGLRRAERRCLPRQCLRESEHTVSRACNLRRWDDLRRPRISWCSLKNLILVSDIMSVRPASTRPPSTVARMQQSATQFVVRSALNNAGTVLPAHHDNVT